MVREVQNSFVIIIKINTCSILIISNFLLVIVNLKVNEIFIILLKDLITKFETIVSSYYSTNGVTVSFEINFNLLNPFNMEVFKVIN